MYLHQKKLLEYAQINLILFPPPGCLQILVDYVQRRSIGFISIKSHIKYYSIDRCDNDNNYKVKNFNT